MDYSVIAAQMADYRQAMVDAVVRLCSIPSVKSAPAEKAPFGLQNVQALEAFLALGQSLGFKATNLDGFCGYLEWGTQGPIVAVLGHLDVVPAVDGWSHDPYTPVVLDDRIIARGTADDKGPLVAALFAMKALSDEGFTPNGRIRLIAGLDEESGSACMKHYVEVAELPACGFTPDANFPVIYAEKGIAHLNLVLDFAASPAVATGRSLVAAEAGQRANMVPARCDLTWRDADGSRATESFAGKAAHGSLPWEGENAISLAMAAAAAQCHHPFVDFYQRCLGNDWTGSALGIEGADSSGPLTLNPGVLMMDSDKACLTIDIRYPSSWRFDDILLKMRQALAPENVNVEILSHTLPLNWQKDAELVRTLMAVYNKMTGTASEAVAIGGGTYARSMPNIVAFGPSFPGDPDVCHQVDEYITIDKLLASAAIYREALRELAR